MRVAIIGSSYVGLVVAACLAEAGNRVTVVDRDAERIATLRAGHCPIHEPGLPGLLDRGRSEGRLDFAVDTVAGVRGAAVVFLAVGTPAGPDGMPRLDDLWSAVDATLEAPGPDGRVLVVKSTVPVGTCATLAARVGPRLRVVSNPEFLKEGSAVADFRRPERVILGTEDPEAIRVLHRLYRPFMLRTDRLLVMDPASAELTKYAANAMLAARVSLVNELSRVCEAVGADIGQVRRGVGSDGRIGPHFLYASLGFGGSCFPKDLEGLAAIGREVGHPLAMVEATSAANRAQRDHWTARVLEALPEGPCTLGVWGLAFKAHTDDVRQSAAVALVATLRDRGHRLRLHDPRALDRARAVLGDEGLHYVDDPYSAVEGADALLLCTEWPVYRTPDFERLAGSMRRPLILDGRNLYDLEWMRETPFTYLSVGRPTVGA